MNIDFSDYAFLEFLKYNQNNPIYQNIYEDAIMLNPMIKMDPNPYNLCSIG